MPDYPIHESLCIIINAKYAQKSSSVETDDTDLAALGISLGERPLASEANAGLALTAESRQ